MASCVISTCTYDAESAHTRGDKNPGNFRPRVIICNSESGVDCRCLKKRARNMANRWTLCALTLILSLTATRGMVTGGSGGVCLLQLQPLSTTIGLNLSSMRGIDFELTE